MMDPDFYEDDGDDFDELIDEAEEYVYDTYDTIFDTNDELDTGVMEELREEFQDDLDRDLNAMHMGMAFALGSEIADARSKNYEVDETTDRKNMEAVTKIVSLKSRHTPKRTLRPFEKYAAENSVWDKTYIDSLFDKD